MKYVWRNPTIYEFFLILSRLSRTYYNLDLIVRLGRDAIKEYSHDYIKQKDRASFGIDARNDVRFRF